MGKKKKLRIICDMSFSQATGKEGFCQARKINSESKFCKLKGQSNRVEKINTTLLLVEVNIFSGLHSDQYLPLADPFCKTVGMSMRCRAYPQRQQERAPVAVVAPFLHSFLEGGGSQC